MSSAAAKLNDVDNMCGRPFPPTRLTSYNDKRIYYSFCRAASEDVLSSLREVPRPAVVLLGSSDMRSLFYTLYKNFDPDFRGRFEGASFIVNENWSVLLARDILMLYLCLQLPEKTEGQEAKEMISAIWAIWFCHELGPPHVEILKSALGALTKYAVSPKAWVSPENPLGKIVKFTTQNSFRDIVQHWGQWNKSEPKNVPTVERLEAERKKFLQRLHKMPVPKMMTWYPRSCLTLLLGLTEDNIADSKKDKMEADFCSFLESGSVFAEPLLNLTTEKERLMTPNVTFFDGSDSTMSNNPFYGLVPFLGFFHSFFFSPKECRSANIARSIIDKLPVRENKFKENPLVANSIQQLALWLSASARVLQQITSQAKPDITFTFDCSDPISFCLRMQRESGTYASYFGFAPSFDAIHTFEMMDCMSPPDLLLQTIPLLKPDALLFATTLRYHGVSNTLDKFMGYVFGVHPQIFGVMYGLRCMGMEASFSDLVLLRHAPWCHLKRGDKGDIKCLIFRRHISSPLKLEHLSEITFGAKALRSCAYATTNSFPTNPYSHHMCTETVLSTMQAFIAQMDADTPVENPYFWEPFVKMIQEQASFDPYRYNLQVTAMLHNVHLHITVTEADCPTCCGRPLSSYLTQFSLHITKPDLGPHCTMAAFIYRGQMAVLNFLQNCKDTHCVDTLTLRTDDRDRTFLDFFFPRKFAEGEYRLSIIKFTPTESGPNKIIHMPTGVYEGKLCNHVVKGSKYYFSRPTPRRASAKTSFGRVTSNVAESDKCRTVIALTADLVYKVDWKSLPVASDQITQRHLELRCASHQIGIEFPYPVLFGDMRIEIHCKLKTATITAPRIQHTFYEESPVYGVSPTNRLFMPAVAASTMSRDFMSLQLNTLEHETLRRMPTAWIPPVLKLKDIIKLLFQQAPQARFMHLSSKEIRILHIQCLVVIHDEVIDLDTKSPAIDLSYCFLQDNVDQPVVTTAWRRMTTGHRISNVAIDSDEFTYVKKMFGYFSERTHPVFSGNNRTTMGMIPVLSKHRVEHCFTRAVVYPLYAGPDHYFEDSAVTKEPEKTGPRFVAGAFAPGRQVTPDDVKKILESLSPQLLGNKGAEMFGLKSSAGFETVQIDMAGKEKEKSEKAPAKTNGGKGDDFDKKEKKPTSQKEDPRSPGAKSEGKKETSDAKGKKKEATSTVISLDLTSGNKDGKGREDGKQTKSTITVAVALARNIKSNEVVVLEQRIENLGSQERVVLQERVALPERSDNVKVKSAEGKTRKSEKASKTEDSARVALSERSDNVKVKSAEGKTRKSEKASKTEDSARVALPERSDSVKVKSAEGKTRKSEKASKTEDSARVALPERSDDGKVKSVEGKSRKSEKTSKTEDSATVSVTAATSSTPTLPYSSSSSSSSSKGKCTNCGQACEHMKKCAGCGKPRYCSQKCQKQHWKQHKPDCIATSLDDKTHNGIRERKKTKKSKSSAAAEEKKASNIPTVQLPDVTKCQTCGKEPSNLKRCKCYAVSYCDVRCQRLDWPNHKKSCSAAPAGPRAV